MALLSTCKRRNTTAFVIRYATHFANRGHVLFSRRVCQVTMNTSLWGPPLWRICHGVSVLFVPSTPTPVSEPISERESEDDMVTFIDLMKTVLPCRFCRESLRTFIPQLADVHASIRAGTLNRWMYDLHNLVNKKLQTQRCVEASITDDAMQAALITLNTLPFDTFLKRVEIASRRLFSVLDIEIVLCIMALNSFDTANADADTNRDNIKAFSAFVRLLGRLLAVCGVTEYGIDAKLVSCEALIKESETAADAIRHILFATSRGEMDTEDAPRNMVGILARYNTARAKACSSQTLTCS